MNSRTESFEVFGELPVELHDVERLLTIVRDVGPPPKPGGSRRKFGQRQKDWVAGFVAQLPSPQLAARMLGISTSNLHLGKSWAVGFLRVQCSESARPILNHPGNTGDSFV